MCDCFRAADESKNSRNVSACETGARIVVLSPLPGAMPGTETYLSLLQYNVIQLANALS